MQKRVVGEGPQGSGCFGGESGGRHKKRDLVEGLSEQGHYLAQPRRGGGQGSSEWKLRGITASIEEGCWSQSSEDSQR